MKHVSSRLCAVMAPVMALVACVETPRLPAEEIRTGRVLESHTSADSDWAALTSSGARPQRMPGENSLAYFMRQVELADVRRRERGLAFWDAYPDDPRRFKWLMLTVHMPPHYAKDIHAWADNETRPEPNTAAVDTAKLGQWQARYPELRAAFWGSSQITDVERRYLWFGELEQALWRAREARARGDGVDTAPLLEDIVSFLTTYPEPFNETDASNYYWVTRTLIEFTLDDHRTFGWDAASLLAYATRLVATGPVAAESNAKAIKAVIEESGRLPTVRYSSMLNVFAASAGLTDAQRAGGNCRRIPRTSPRRRKCASSPRMTGW